MLGGSSNNALSHVTVANNGNSGVYLNSSSNNYFTGLLKVGNNNAGGNGNDCFEVIGTNPGLDDATCANNGSSDATLTTGVTLASSFVAKVGTGGSGVDATEDSANPEDDATPGTASYPADPTTFDWTSFENSYRGWGIDGLLPFPNADHQGPWTTGTGRIWDWSLSTSDTGIIRNAVTALPTGNDTMTHTWLGASTVTYLRNAVEIMGDGLDNDNGLCETGETCLFTPNIGSYQGHIVDPALNCATQEGNFCLAGTIGAGGTVENITLLEYDTNGY